MVGHSEAAERVEGVRVCGSPRSQRGHGPWSLKAQAAPGRMGSDELNGSKTNPSVSKELFNCV